MANVDKPMGLRPVKHTNGSPYNGQANIYRVVSAADEILVNDVVKLGGTADANGIPSVDLCGATDVPVGIVVGIMHSKFDPVAKLTTGSTTLDLPNSAQIAASGAGYVLVADSPDIVMEAQADEAVALVDVGLNVSHLNGTRTSSTVTSPAEIDASTKATTSTLNFRILGFPLRVDNEVAAADNKVLVGFNVHQFGSVGTTGI